MKLARILLGIFFVSLVTIAQAQKNMRYSSGYIIKSGDTLYGDIQSALQRKLQAGCTFRPKGTAQFTTYSPSEIIGFNVEDLGFFESKTNVPLEKGIGSYFLQVIEKGRVTLFFLVDSKGKPHYFIEKDSLLKELVQKVTTSRNDAGQITKKTDYFFRGVLSAFFTECPQRVDKLSLSKKGLTKVIFNYNKCVDPNHSSVKKENSQIYFGVVGGIILNNLEMKNLADEIPVMVKSEKGYANISTYTKSYSFQSGGLGISIELPLGTDRHFSVLSNLLYSTNRFSSDELKLDYVNLNIPVYAKYKTLLNRRLRPYFAFGVVIPFKFKNNTSSTPLPVFKADGNPILKDDGTQYYTEPMQRDRLDVAKLHFVGITGLDFILSERSKFSSQALVERVGMYNSAWLDVDLKGIGVMVIYSYRLAQ